MVQPLQTAFESIKRETLERSLYFACCPSGPLILKGQVTRLKIRSQDVTIATTRPDNISIQNCLHGSITQISCVAGTVFFDVGNKLDDNGNSSNIIQARITK